MGGLIFRGLIFGILWHLAQKLLWYIGWKTQSSAVQSKYKPAHEKATNIEKEVNIRSEATNEYVLKWIISKENHINQIFDPCVTRITRYCVWCAIHMAKCNTMLKKSAVKVQVWRLRVKCNGTVRKWSKGSNAIEKWKEMNKRQQLQLKMIL